MRVLIISDIHANIEALTRILEISEGVDAVWALGDIIGYGPNPAECLSLIKEKAAIVLCGNHDMAVSGALPFSSFNSQAQKAVEYTRKMLKKKDIDYLNTLSPIKKGKNITLVHGSPTNPAVDYILNKNSAAAAHELITTEICFFGHTHLPGCFYKRGNKYIWKKLKANESIPLGKNHVFYNPGSAGQPRDNDPRASFAIADTEKMTWTQKRTEYDIPAVQAKLKALDAPEFLITRMERGI